MKKILLSIAIVASSISAMAQIPSTGLIAYYPLNQTCDDHSGNNHHATGTDVNFVAGRANGSFAADFASTSRIQYNYAANYSDFQSDFFSLGAWVNLDTPPINGGIYNIVSFGDNDVFIRFYQNGANLILQAGYRTGAGNSFQVASATVSSSDFVGNWRFISCTKNGSSFNLNVEQYLVGTASSIMRYYNTDKALRIGHFMVQQYPADAKIQDVFYYSSALSTLDLVKLSCNVEKPFSTTPIPDQQVCTGSSTILTAGHNSSYQINWHSSSMGNSLITTGTSYTTPNLSAGTTYYIDAANGSGCVSYPPVPIQVNVTSSPFIAPVNTTPLADLTVCPGGTPTLSVSGDDIVWFDVPAGGTPIASGTTFSTPSINITTTYYAQAGGTGVCASARTAITVNIGANPSAPVNTTPAPNLNTCGIWGSVLTATAGGTISWFDVATGGTSLGQGTSFYTPPLPNPTNPGETLTVTYYAESSENGCISDRTQIDITVKYTYPAPVNTTPIENLTICSGTSANLSVDSDYPVEWTEMGSYTTVGYGLTVTTPVLTSNGGYFAGVTAPNGCHNSIQIFVTVVTADIPVNTTPTTNTLVCAGETTTLTATGTETLYWFDVATGGTHLGTGNSFVTPVITSDTTYYVQEGNGSCASARVAIQVNTIASSTGTATISACGSYTWIDGNTYTASNNTATYTLSNSVGCDSVVTLNLTINLIDNTLTVNGTTITSNQNGATYQWIDCDNGNAPIAGETGQSFTPTSNGVYAVEITLSGCVYMSSCYVVSNLSIHEINDSFIQIYPSPANTILNIDISTTLNADESTNITIVNILGATVATQQLKTGNNTIDVGHLTSGVYFITTETGASIKFVKE
jgi:hypothetical protein